MIHTPHPLPDCERAKTKLSCDKKKKRNKKAEQKYSRVGNGCALAAQEEAAKTKAKSHSDILADATERIGRARKDTRADTDTDTFHISDFPPCDIFYLFTPLGPLLCKESVCSVVFVFDQTRSAVSVMQVGVYESQGRHPLHARPQPSPVTAPSCHEFAKV